MTVKRNLDERQNELRSLLTTPAGRAAVEALAARYAEASGRLRPARTSAITYILVHEKERGLISG
jgi:hypothetical protein